MTESEIRQRKILRFAFGVTLGFTVAQVLAWTASYMMPILLALLLTSANFDVKTGLKFLGAMVAGCAIGIVVSMTIVNYPLACVLFLGLALFHIFLASNKGMPIFGTVMLLLAVTVIPLVGLPSLNISLLLVESLIISGSFAVAIALLSFQLFPTPPEEVDEADTDLNLTPEEAALGSTIVILPLLILFYSFSIYNAIVVLVFAALIAQSANLASTRKMGMGLVVANLIGGVTAVLIYSFLLIVPEIYFMIPLIALAALIFGSRLFSGDPTAALYQPAFNSVLLLVGSSVASSTGDDSIGFITRLTQIFLAALYVVAAFTLLKKFKDARDADRAALSHV